MKGLKNHTILTLALVLVTLLVASGCKSSTPAPQATRAPAVTPAMTSAPAATPQPKAAWETKWETTLQEAKKEGVVYVYGPPMPDVRTGWVDGFQKAYPGIKLDYTALSGGEVGPKVKAEHGAGVYNVDMVVSGTTTILTSIRPNTQPIKPFLILPEVTDTKKWMEGKLEFADKAGETNLVFTYATYPAIMYNTEIVDPAEITSWWDIVKPKWKGKINLWDPAVPGAGGSATQLWYVHPELGQKYFEAFIANEPVIMRDIRLQVETVGRAKYLLAVAPSTT
ncbi:MAG: extracellular solute-binding protein, partial [Dehalococcoidia bacterium]|nr:extracellular solute-binding protein [Dehalococcoidia bacterium]